VHVYPLWSSSLVLEAVNTVEKEDTHESSVDPSMNFLQLFNRFLNRIWT